MAEHVAVLGAGSWGTALAISLASYGQKPVLWARRHEVIDYIRRNRRHPDYLQSVPIPESVDLTQDLACALQGAGIWVFCTPSQALRPLAAACRELVQPDTIIVSVAKGIENGTLLTTSQVIKDALPGVADERIGVLYGPSHAEEVAIGQPTTLVAAAPSLMVAEAIQDVFMSPRLRVYTSTDRIGVEIAGSVKNIMAIAAGMSDGVGYGDNAKAAIITRGISEISRLGLALGANPSTFAGLAGIGDLVVTCTSRHSRNRYFGEEIGKGRTREEVEAGMSMVAEGVRTTMSVHDLAARLGIEMPITEAVYQILFEGVTPDEAMQALMTRTAKFEDPIARSEIG